MPTGTGARPRPAARAALGAACTAAVIGQRPTLIQLAGAVLVCCTVLVVARARHE